MSNLVNSSIILSYSKSLEIEPEQLIDTLKKVVFKVSKDAPPITDPQMIALLHVAKEYNLNPFTKELYAFPDKSGGIVPMVGVDGWIRIINNQKELDGIEFIDSENLITMTGAKICPDWIECCIYRKDRNRPIKIKEYLGETYIGTRGANKYEGPWQTHTKRMLRHKALIQCARVAFGFSGIYDEDEAHRIIEGESERENYVQEDLDLKTKSLTELKEKIRLIGWDEKAALLKFGVRDFMDMPLVRMDKAIDWCDIKIKKITNGRIENEADKKDKVG